MRPEGERMRGPAAAPAPSPAAPRPRPAQEHHESYHRVWGQLLKTGHQNSWFAHQAERFACTYTSHVSNLAFFSPDKSYVARMDGMAHEEWVSGGEAPGPEGLGAYSVVGGLQ
jgi:hypothetical protein